VEQTKLRLESASEADRIRSALGSSSSKHRQLLIEMAAAIVAVTISSEGAPASEKTRRTVADEER
jgi:hypothetical protein